MRGLVNITYFSGEGKGLQGCKPYVNFRKALLRNVLLREEDLVPEEERHRPVPGHHRLPGDRAFVRHQALWETYLAPEFVDPNRKR